MTAPRSVTSATRRMFALTALRWLPVGLLTPVLVLLAQERGLTGFLVASVVKGVGRALDSGPLEAWYVDTVHLDLVHLAALLPLVSGPRPPRGGSGAAGVSGRRRPGAPHRAAAHRRQPQPGECVPGAVVLLTAALCLRLPRSPVDRHPRAGAPVVPSRAWPPPTTSRAG